VLGVSKATISRDTNLIVSDETIKPHPLNEAGKPAGALEGAMIEPPDE
jgi:hypothetical protein